MRIPDLFGCPHCDRSLRRGVRSCPGCGYSTGVVRLRVTVGNVENVVEKLVAPPPEEFAHIRAVEFLAADDPDKP